LAFPRRISFILGLCPINPGRSPDEIKKLADGEAEASPHIGRQSRKKQARETCVDTNGTPWAINMSPLLGLFEMFLALRRRRLRGFFRERVARIMNSPVGIGEGEDNESGNEEDDEREDRLTVRVGCADDRAEDERPQP